MVSKGQQQSLNRAKAAQKKQQKRLEKIRKIVKKQNLIKQGFTRKTSSQTFGEAVGPTKTRSGGSSGPRQTQAIKTPVKAEPVQEVKKAEPKPKPKQVEQINQGTKFTGPTELSRQQTPHLPPIQPRPQSTVTARPPPTGLFDRGRRFLQEKRQPIEKNPATGFAVGVGTTLLGTAEFVKESTVIAATPFTKSSREKIRLARAGIVETGRKIVSREGFPELGRVLRNEPGFVAGNIAASLGLSAVGGGVTSRVGTKISTALKPLRKVELTGRVAQTGKSVTLGSRTTATSQAEFVGSGKSFLQVGKVKFSKKTFENVGAKVNLIGDGSISRSTITAKTISQKSGTTDFVGKGVSRTRGDRGADLFEIVGSNTAGKKKPVTFTRGSRVFEIIPGERQTTQVFRNIPTRQGDIVQESVRQQFPSRIEGITKITIDKRVKTGKQLSKQRRELIGSFEDKLSFEIGKKGRVSTTSDVGLSRATFERPLLIKQSQTLGGVRVDVTDVIGDSSKLTFTKASSGFSETFSSGVKQQRKSATLFKEKASKLVPREVKLNPSQVLGISLPTPSVKIKLPIETSTSGSTIRATGLFAKDIARESILSASTGPTRFGGLGKSLGLTGPTKTSVPSFQTSNIFGSGLKPISIPISGSSTGPRTKPSIDVGLLPRTKPALKPALKPSLKPALKPALQPALKPSLKPALKPALQPALKPLLRPALRPSLFPGPKPFLIDIPGIPGTPFGSQRKFGKVFPIKTKKKKLERVLEYRPSLVALEGKIKGRRPKVLTGFGIRPI